MEREIKTIKLSDCEVDIATSLTWGEKESLDVIVISGVRIKAEGDKEVGISGFNAQSVLDAKYKAFEICVKEIRKDDTKKPYSREWVDTLSIDDGDKLYKAVDEITGKKKE